LFAISVRGLSLLKKRVHAMSNDFEYAWAELGDYDDDVRTAEKFWDIALGVAEQKLMERRENFMNVAAAPGIGTGLSIASGIVSALRDC
jgi:hypothetical protein